MAYKYNYFSQEDPLYLEDKLPYVDTLRNFKNTRELEEEEERKRKLQKQQQLQQQKQQQQQVTDTGSILSKMSDSLNDSINRATAKGEYLLQQNPQQNFAGKGYTDTWTTNKEDKQIAFAKQYNDSFIKDVVGIVRGITDLEKEERNSDKLYDFFINHEQEYRNVKAAYPYFFTDGAGFDSNDGQTNMLNYLGIKYLSYDEKKFDEFMSLDKEKKLQMLSAEVKNNPFYQTEKEKIKERGNSEAHRIFGLDEELENARRNAADPKTDLLTKLFLGTTSSIASMLSSAYEGIDKIFRKSQYTSEREKELGAKIDEIDNIIAEKSDRFITDKAIEKQRSEYRNENATDILKEWEELSEKSNYYRAEKGNAYTALDFDKTLENYYKHKVREEMFGKEIAQQQLLNFWKDTVAGRLGLSDRIYRAIASNTTSFAADLLSLAAVLYGGLETPYQGLLNVFRDDEHDKGYADVWMNGNTWSSQLLNYATDLQETGTFKPEDQQKYKELELSANQQYATNEQESSIFSQADFFDAVGQYGFTAATILASLGLSALLKSGTKGVANAFSRSVLKGMGKKDALKLVLSESGVDATTKMRAIQEIMKLQQNVRYYGNLGIAAFMGTGEGALEAKSTYNTFIKDNMANVEQSFNERIKKITNDDIINYLIATDVKPALLVNTSDGGAVTRYSEQQLQYGHQQLLKKLDDRKNEVLKQVEDDAAAASLMNFGANAFINGAANVFLKDIAFSSDTRNAVRRFRNKRKWQNEIDIEETNGKFRATAKNSKTPTGFWHNASDFVNRHAILAVPRNIIKQATGEGIEEYLQTVSDHASRDAMAADLQEYIETALNFEGNLVHNANLSGIIKALLDSVDLTSRSEEAYKAFQLGFVSTALGGFSLGHIPAAINRTKDEFEAIRNRNYDENGKWYRRREWMDKTLAVAKGLSETWESGIRRGYRDYKENDKTKQRLVDWINTWLEDEKHQDVLKHLGAAAGFKAAMEQALAEDSVLYGKDNFLALSLQNALLLQDFAGTGMGQMYLQKLAEQASLTEIIDDNTFDQNGNLTEEAQENFKAIVREFKVRNLKENANTGMTDRQIVEKVAKNAQEFLEFKDRVAQVRKNIQEIFADDNIDRTTEEAFIHAYLLQEDSAKRKLQMQDEREAIFTSEEFKQGDGSTLTNIDEQQTTDRNLLDILTQFGSIEKAKKKLKELIDNKNSATAQANDKNSTKSQKRFARKQAASYQEAYNELFEKIEAAETEIEERSTKSNSVAKSDAVFTERDILQMSVSERATVLKNREKGVYSDAQNNIIDRFLERTQNAVNARNNQLAQSEGRLIQNKDRKQVLNDFTDEAQLEYRKNIYNSMLVQFMNDAESINQSVSFIRNERTKQILKSIYGQELNLKDDENLLEYKERLDARANDILEERGAYEYKIFKQLLNEQKDYKKITETESKIEDIENKLTDEINDRGKIIRSLGIEVNAEDSKERRAQVEAEIQEKGNELIRKKLTLLKKAKIGLQTLACAGLDYKTICQYIDSQDKQAELRSEKGILVRRKDGELVLQHLLELGGFLNEGEALTDDMIDDVLSCVKQTLVQYQNLVGNKTQQQSTSQQQTSETQPATEGQTSKATYKPAQTTQQTSPQTSPQTKPAKINIPGQYKLMNLLTSANTRFRKFLEDYGLYEGKFDSKSNDQIHFVVATVNENVDPELNGILRTKLIAVRPLGFESAGNHITINGVRYVPIGAIDMETTSVSQTLRNAFEFTVNYANLSSMGFALVTQDGQPNGRPITTGYAKFGKTYMTVSNYINFSKIIGNIKQIRDWFNMNLRNFVMDFKVQNDKKIPYLRYKDLIVTTKTKPGTNSPESIFNLVLDGKTVLQHIFEDNFDRLFQNEFFNEMLNTWRNSRFYNKTNSAVYKELIGNFIYNDFLTEKNVIQILDADKTFNSDNPVLQIKLMLDQEQRILTIPIDLQSPEVSLRNTLMLLAQANDVLMNAPQLDYQKIQKAAKGSLMKESVIKTFMGLIELGGLNCSDPSFLDRELVINDPYQQPVAVKNLPELSSTMDPELELDADEERTQDAFEKARQRIADKKEAARQFIHTIKQASENVHLEDDNSDADVYIDESNNGRKKRARVTALEDAQMDQRPHGFTQQQKNKGVIAQAHGNIVDDVVRTFIRLFVEKRNNNEQVTVEDVLNDLRQAQPEGFHMKNGIEHFYLYRLDYIENYVNQLIEFGRTIPTEWELYPVDIKVKGSFNVVNGKNKVGTMPVAGTLDLLVIDSNGDIGVIDIKTKQNMTTWAMSVPGWQQQTFSYACLIKQMLEKFAQQSNIKGIDRIRFTQPYILLNEVFYTSATSEEQVITLEDNRRTLSKINEQDNTKVDSELGYALAPPTLAPLTKGVRKEKAEKDESILSVDYLVPIEEPEHITTDIQESRIPENLLELVERTPQSAVTTQQPEKPVPPPVNPTVTEEPTEEPAEKPTKPRTRHHGRNISLGDILNSDNDASIHSEQERRQMNFLNTRMYPVAEIAVNVLTRIKRSAKARFKLGKNKIRNAILQDLSITFFDGSLTKLDVVLGKINIISNTQEAITAIKNYFQVNIEKKQQCVQSIARRHNVAKYMYSYLKEEITFEQLMEQLNKLNVTADSIPELQELQNSEDVETTRKNLIERMELAKLYDSEQYNQQIKNIDAVVDDMQVKLNFLNSVNAADLIQTRMQSIADAIRDGDIVDVPTERQTTIADILQKKSGVRNARNILADIANQSQDREFRILAKRLLSLLMHSKNEVRLVFDNDTLIDTEGQSFGLCVRIFKTGMKDRATFERTVLHEMLHALVTDSDYVKTEIQIIMDQYLNKLSSQTGTPTDVLKQSIYGFTNVREFISEFFTNPLFQETLKTVSDEFDEEQNFFEKIFNKIVDFITGRKTQYDKLRYKLYNMLDNPNLHQQVTESRINRSKKLGKISFEYDVLDAETKNALEQRGITKDEFENLPAMVQEQIIQCC